MADGQPHKLKDTGSIPVPATIRAYLKEIGRRGGIARRDTRTPNQRREDARMGGVARSKVRTPEQRREDSRKGGLAAAARKRQELEHAAA